MLHHPGDSAEHLISFDFGQKFLFPIKIKMRMLSYSKKAKTLRALQISPAIIRTSI
jgi:hypothetical protein